MYTHMMYPPLPSGVELLEVLHVDGRSIPVSFLLARQGLQQKQASQHKTKQKTF